MTERHARPRSLASIEALVADYDGTLAREGRVAPTTLAALERWRRAGRRLVVATGRQLEDLLGVFGQAESLCDRIVAENGAVLHHPAARATRDLGEPPAPAFLRALRQRGVDPLSVGRVIVATRQPHAAAVAEILASLGVDLEVIENKGAIMILPRGVHKGSGALAALHALGISPDRAAGIGDAENDAALLHVCGHAVAVAGAVDELKTIAAEVTAADDGDGVVELVDRLLGEAVLGR